MVDISRGIGRRREIAALHSLKKLDDVRVERLVHNVTDGGTTI